MKVDKSKPKIIVWVKAVHRGLATLNTVDCIVRSARWEDLIHIISIEKQSFPPEEVFPSWIFINILKLDPELLIVVDCKGSIEGYAMGVVEDDTCHLISIAVAPSSRGKGLGRMLLKSFEGICKDRGLAKVVLEVKVDNIIALNLYKSEGYKVERILPRYYPDGSNAYRMTKRI
jgi:ribosomal-protein-alanine N-acetyltransferase